MAKRYKIKRYYSLVKNGILHKIEKGNRTPVFGVRFPFKLLSVCSVSLKFSIFTSTTGAKLPCFSDTNAIQYFIAL